MLTNIPMLVVAFLLLTGLLLLIGLTLLIARLPNRPQCDSAPTIELVTQIAAAQPYVLTGIIQQQPDYIYRDALLSSAPLMGRLARYRLASIDNGTEISPGSALICTANLVVTTHRDGEFIGQIQYIINQSDNGQLVAAII